MNARTCRICTCRVSRYSCAARLHGTHHTCFVCKTVVTDIMHILLNLAKLLVKIFSKGKSQARMEPELVGAPAAVYTSLTHTC